ncbi:putative NAD dependent epimerase/dehydratase [Trichoderma sp. SZMC 28015]
MSSSKVTVPKGSWVLVTGVNGFVGTHVAKQFLEHGYKVRGTVRDVSLYPWLANDLFKTYAQSGDFEVVAADLEADNAFEEAVKGVQIIQHVASVMSFSPDPNTVIPQTVKGVTSLLEAAIKEPSVKEFVYTSSLVASTAPALGNNTNVTRDSWNDMAVELAWAPPPYEPSRGPVVYMASKTIAEKAAWDFVKDKKPHFTLNVVAPSGIIGEPLNKFNTDKGSSWLKYLYDGSLERIIGMPANWVVDVKDTALLHVAAALDPETKGERIQAWGNNVNWDDFLAIFRDLYPNEKWIDDFTGKVKLSITTDQTPALALLKKWGNQDGWTTPRDSVAQAVDVYLKWYPRS